MPMESLRVSTLYHIYRLIMSTLESCFVYNVIQRQTQRKLQFYCDLQNERLVSHTVKTLLSHKVEWMTNALRSDKKKSKKLSTDAPVSLTCWSLLLTSHGLRKALREHCSVHLRADSNKGHALHFNHTRAVVIIWLSAFSCFVLSTPWHKSESLFPTTWTGQNSPTGAVPITLYKVRRPYVLLSACDSVYDSFCIIMGTPTTAPAVTKLDQQTLLITLQWIHTRSTSLLSPFRCGNQGSALHFPHKS